ncbi:hypothetical protein QFC22_003844 [Naganishia vaughanmartiniae]|uniref:Uncharacterized protein n=1 Tax=Naganishia vaughanmartiniae TaxID=1424756 RepID=A0ACC2X5H7_9TREE|nr:hypothetical protein QFC22_003844 [Naganishia vaughanmartiniae]
MSPNLLLPRLYASHPSRPPACSLSTLDPDTPTGPYIVVIVVIPSPTNVEDERKLDALQQLRQRWDQAYPRWVPHVTLIPPFVVPQQDEPQGAGTSVQMNTFQPPEEKRAEEKEQQGVTVFAPQPSTTEASSQDAAPPLPEFAQYSPRVITTAQDVSSALNGLSETLTRVCAETPVFKFHLNDVGTFKLREYTNVHLRPRLGTTSGEESLLTTLHTRLVIDLPAYVTAPEGRRKPHHPPTRAQSNSRHPQQLFSADNSPDTRIKRSERRRRATEEAGIVSLPVQVGKKNTERSEFDPSRAGADLQLREERHVTIPFPIERRGIPEASMARDQGDPTLQQESIATTSNDRQPERRASSSGRAGASQSDQQKPRANRAGKRKFQPHVSVGQARGYSQLQTLEKLARELLRPEAEAEAEAEGGEGGVDGIECLVDKVYLLAKPQGKTGPYELFKVVHLARPQTSESEAKRMRVVEGTQCS